MAVHKQSKETRREALSLKREAERTAASLEFVIIGPVVYVETEDDCRWQSVVIWKGKPGISVTGKPTDEIYATALDFGSVATEIDETDPFYQACASVMMLQRADAITRSEATELRDAAVQALVGLFRRALYPKTEIELAALVVERIPCDAARALQRSVLSELAR
jgi:hypothetical protein